MGIRGLYNLLELNKCIKYYKKIPSNINNIAIDANLYLYKYLYSKNSDILYSILNQVLKFLSVDITPIYIFDGKPPVEKNKTIWKRKYKKLKFQKKINDLYLELEKSPNNLVLKDKIQHLKNLSHNLNLNIINDVKSLLDILNIKYINADGEADFLCCKLCHNNIVDACLTEDMDFLLLKCNNIISFMKKGVVKLYNMNYILEKLNISENQLIDICSILGSDYHNDKIKISPESILENIRFYKSIDNWIIYEENTYLRSYLNNSRKIKEFIQTTIKDTKISDNIKNIPKQNSYIDINNLKLFFDERVSENTIPYHNSKKIKLNIQAINMKLIEY